MSCTCLSLAGSLSTLDRWLAALTEADAAATNFTITHKGQCASCSSLQDLGVYVGQNLTTPVRLCGLEGIVSEALMERCLKNLGFSDNCIPIWKDNILKNGFSLIPERLG